MCLSIILLCLIILSSLMMTLLNLFLRQISDMSSLVPKPPETGALYESTMRKPFVSIKSKIAYEYDDQYHKGYLTKLDDVYRFIFKTHVNKK